MSEVKITRAGLVADYAKALADIPTIEAHTREILVDTYDQSLLQWEVAVVDRLHERARYWESVMEDGGDTTLYSLGLRHAEDIVLGAEVDINKPVPGTEELDTVPFEV